MAASNGPSRAVILRDLIIFQVKLSLDGLKDLVLSPISLFAAAVDILTGPRGGPTWFYRVLRLGERFDLWLNLFSASERAAASREGLFGPSRAGDRTFLGELEELSGGERGGADAQDAR